MNRLEKIQMAIDKGITCDPETGEVFGIRGNVLTKKTSRLSKYDDGRYMIIQFQENNKTYQIKSHHFIWYWKYQELPERIDHINQNKSDNRIENLRILTNIENCHNNLLSSKGYTFQNNKYRVKIKVNYKTIHIGYYNTEQEARQAYLQAKKKYFPNL
jgi:hypothetical protein